MVNVANCSVYISLERLYLLFVILGNIFLIASHSTFLWLCLNLHNNIIIRCAVFTYINNPIVNILIVKSLL